MKRLLNRRRRLALFKFFALLSLVRWYNILVIIAAQYLASVFMLNADRYWLDVVLDPGLLLVALSTGFIVASGFIINAFYDLERDVINKPHEVVFDRLLSRQTSLNFYFLFNTVGMILSFYVSKRLMLFNFLFSIALWFYSHKIKKQGFFANLTAVLLTVTPFLAIVVYYEKIGLPVFLYVAFIALIQLIREVIKDILAQKGDLIYGYHSVPVDFGVEKSKRLIYTLIALTPFPPAVLYVFYSLHYVVFYFVAALIALSVTAVMVNRAEQLKQFKLIDTILKTLIATGILSIALI